MIARQPLLTTERLILRPFTFDDGERVRELAGDRQVYETTLNVPHPYQEGAAERWIATHAKTFYEGNGVVCAVVEKVTGDLIGAVSFGINRPHRRAELGWWIGVAYWNRGYCTEAARLLIDYGFETFNLHKFTSRHLAMNPASGRVMEKVGMQKEGFQRAQFFKDGVAHDSVEYGLLREDWEKMAR